ncbi:MAG: hypothetical protein K0R02_638 [Rickettsiaceae bacterium]|jgi:hypothetical protein|nr:hypothetical protein [Rickettsiaceae bacterium]
MRNLIILLLPFLITACAIDPDGYFKRSANNKLYDSQGFDGQKRRPIYNKKYIDQAKRNIIENNVASNDEDYDDDISELEDTYKRNREMYLQMLDQDIAKREKREPQKNSFLSKILPNKLQNTSTAEHTVLVKNEIKDEVSLELAKTKKDLLREIAEIKLLLSEAKATIVNIKNQDIQAGENIVALKDNVQSPDKTKIIQGKSKKVALKEEKSKDKKEPVKKDIGNNRKLALNKDSNQAKKDASDKNNKFVQGLIKNKNDKAKKEMLAEKDIKSKEVILGENITTKVTKLPDPNSKNDSKIAAKEVLTTYIDGVDGFTEDELIIVRGQEYKAEQQNLQVEVATQKVIAKEIPIENEFEDNKPKDSKIVYTKNISQKSKEEKLAKTQQNKAKKEVKENVIKTKIVAPKLDKKVAAKAKIKKLPLKQATAQLKKNAKHKLAQAEKSIEKAKKLRTKAELAKAKKQQALEEKLAKEKAERLAQEQKKLENLPWLDEDVVTVTPTNEIVITKKPRG